MHPIVFQPVVNPFPVAEEAAEEIVEELSLLDVVLDDELETPTLDVSKLELL
jgi:hypothetical protein